MDILNKATKKFIPHERTYSYMFCLRNQSNLKIFSKQGAEQNFYCSLRKCIYTNSLLDFGCRIFFPKQESKQNKIITNTTSVTRSIEKPNSVNVNNRYSSIFKISINVLLHLNNFFKSQKRSRIKTDRELHMSQTGCQFQ